MTTHDDEFAKKITDRLDHATGALRAGTAYRLQLARQQALAAVGEAHRVAEPHRVAQPHPAAVAAGRGTSRLGARRGFGGGAWLWLGIAAIVIAGFGYQGYQHWEARQHLKDVEETDAALLSSDLPIDAYLDRGFQNWLKHVEQ